MKISVITICYNAASTIADTIQSVRAQDYGSYEHIIVDGQSTDGTLDFIETHRHPNLSVRSEPDAGIYDAMNKGLQRAQGDLIGFLNADDFLCRTDALSMLARTISQSAADAVVGAVAIVDAKAPAKVKRAYSPMGFQPWMLRFGHMPPHPGFYITRKALAQVGEFNAQKKIGGDFDWMVRFFMVHALRAGVLPETIVGFRSGGVSTQGFGSLISINREARQSLAQNGYRASSAMIWLKYLAKSMQLVGRAHAYPAPTDVRWMPDVTR